MKCSNAQKNVCLAKYLWCPNRASNILKTVTFHFPWVPYGASKYPVILAATISHRSCQQVYPTMTSTLDKCLYVEGLICGAHSVEAQWLIPASLNYARMNWCKWSVNSGEPKCLWNRKHVEVQRFLDSCGVSGKMTLCLFRNVSLGRARGAKFEWSVNDQPTDISCRVWPCFHWALRFTLLW